MAGIVGVLTFHRQKVALAAAVVSKKIDENGITPLSTNAMSKPRWKNIGTFEVNGPMCEWKVRLAAKPVGEGTWLVRWTGEEGEPFEIGPDTLENLQEELISMGINERALSATLEF